MLNGYLLIILTAIGFAALPIFIKQGYNLGLTIDVILILRFFIASILLVFIMFVHRRKGFNPYKAFMPQLLIQGLLFFGSAYCYTLSIKYMTATITNILLYTYPVMVVLMSALIFKEKVSLVKWITLLTAFTGCLMVIDVINISTQQVSKLGILYGVGSAVFYATYNINGQYLSDKLEPLTISAYTSIVCLLATMLVYSPTNVLTGYTNLSMWVVGFGTAIICTVLPLFCYQKGLAALGATRASILSTIEPVITTVLAGVILGESLTISQLTGGFLIILGVMILKLDKFKPYYTLKHRVSHQVQSAKR